MEGLINQGNCNKDRSDLDGKDDSNMSQPKIFEFSKKYTNDCYTSTAKINLIT